jgi:hypothetical protein
MAAFEGFDDVWARVALQAQESAAFRSRLVGMPTLVLNEHGASLPVNLNTRVLEDGQLPSGSWQMRRHGDKTTLALGLAPVR